MKTLVISAAGGNPTAVRIIKSKLTRKEYENFGKQLMSDTEKFGVEQAGFLIHERDSENHHYHFEMSGGEFCGNAARSAALILNLETGKSDNIFTMSGFKGTVYSHVEKISDKRFKVSCEFLNFELSVVDVKINDVSAKKVDLGGIVHIVINDNFPSNYEKIHESITKDLNLRERDAVGVVWTKKVPDGITINPVVWVKSIDTFFHETSCGSGSIAVAKTTGEKRIFQPSNGEITVTILNSNIKLESEMEIIFEENAVINYKLISKEKNFKNYKEEFIVLYKDAFDGPPYFEEYENSWIEKNVWNLHLEKGCIFVALWKNEVVGLACAIPVVLDKKIISFLEKKELPFSLKSTLYMSELATSRLFRKSNQHIGTNLVRKRIEWGKNNFFDSYLMRTAAENSNSENLYIKIGAQKLDKIVQEISENPEEIASASDKRIYLYGKI